MSQSSQSAADSPHSTMESELGVVSAVCEGGLWLQRSLDRRRELALDSGAPAKVMLIVAGPSAYSELALALEE